MLFSQCFTESTSKLKSFKTLARKSSSSSLFHLLHHFKDQQSQEVIKQWTRISLLCFLVSSRYLSSNFILEMEKSVTSRMLRGNTSTITLQMVHYIITTCTRTLLSTSSSICKRSFTRTYFTHSGCRVSDLSREKFNRRV